MVSKQNLTSAGNDFEFPMGSKVTRPVKDLKMNIQITFPYHRFSGSWKKIIEKLTMFPMSPDDHLLTNRKQSLIRSKQTPDPSVQFLVNMQTTDKCNADEQLRIGWPYANANWFQIRYDNYNGFKFDFNPEYVWIWYYSATTFGRSIKKRWRQTHLSRWLNFIIIWSWNEAKNSCADIVEGVRRGEK